MPAIPRLRRVRGGDRDAVDPARMLRRRRGPVQVALGALLVLLVLAAEVLLLRAYADISETTDQFGRSTYLAGNLVNTQRETLLLTVEVERAEVTGDLATVDLRRALLQSQLDLLTTQDVRDPEIVRTARTVVHELTTVDRLIERARRARAGGGRRAALAAASVRLRDLERLLKATFDHQEQTFYGAIGAGLRAKVTSERVLVALSVLVLLVGLTLGLSLRQRARADFAKAWHALRAEVEERKSAEAAVRASEERFRSLVQNSSDLVAVLDGDATIRWHSESATRLLGVEPAALIGTTLLDLVHPDDRAAAGRFVDAAVPRPGVTAAAAWRVRHRGGHWLDCETIATNLLGDPNVGGLVLNMRDVTERKQLEAQLAHQAFHDALTGLANRRLFTERIELALARGGAAPVVLFVDLDDFKTVNDTLGHAAGDELLVTIADRLLGCMRASDTAARFGGDEFAVLLESGDETSAAAVAERILTALHEPVSLQGRDVLVRASMGIALAGEAARSADELLRNADVAMYVAKAAGKGRFELFEPSMHADMVDQLELEAELRHAVDRGELVLHYQPTVELASGRITGLEALVRWAHPTRGLLGPDAFVPLAEERGTIVAIGRWVLQEASRQARRWQEEFPDLPPLAVNVNLSGRQLERPELLGEVAEALVASRLDPALLTLEMTETVLLDDSEATIARLRELKALGVRLAIDDFGTGYSSLGYLKRFPIDVLKIDKAFVDGVGRGPEDAALAQAVIRLCQALGLRAVGEGVERPAQAAGLLALGCHEAQGYHFGRPAPAEAIGDLLRASRPAEVTPAGR